MLSRFLLYFFSPVTLNIFSIFLLMLCLAWRHCRKVWCCRRPLRTDTYRLCWVFTCGTLSVTLCMDHIDQNLHIFLFFTPFCFGFLFHFSFEHISQFISINHTKLQFCSNCNMPWSYSYPHSGLYYFVFSFLLLPLSMKLSYVMRSVLYLTCILSLFNHEL